MAKSGSGHGTVWASTSSEPVFDFTFAAMVVQGVALTRMLV